MSETERGVCCHREEECVCRRFASLVAKRLPGHTIVPSEWRRDIIALAHGTAPGAILLTTNDEPGRIHIHGVHWAPWSGGWHLNRYIGTITLEQWDQLGAIAQSHPYHGPTADEVERTLRGEA